MMCGGGGGGSILETWRLSGNRVKPPGQRRGFPHSLRIGGCCWQFSFHTWLLPLPSDLFSLLSSSSVLMSLLLKASEGRFHTKLSGVYHDPEGRSANRSLLPPPIPTEKSLEIPSHQDVAKFICTFNKLYSFCKANIILVSHHSI